MLIVKGADAVRFPTSVMPTQNVPAPTLTIICGVDPAIASGVELIAVQTVDWPVVDPMANPTATGAGEPRLTSVTLTGPACFTVNVKVFVLLGASVPEKTSVGAGAVGVVGDVGSSISPHPEATITDRAT